ncbi:hypothetical protein ASZ78_003892 [Callipepla squamata]|uniref:Serine/arginine repetitive matrix protein C-terminal domain-containing protein n=1 Tax=Callipepla squamata TaxID=9009 RepID=A0A226ML51_CALSU|nr:hypothetical protein ASZ78_003892 [Callipepla squamata]
MASVQQGEKQLFEKFWRGTFKAVATPRPESIIVASITARKPLPSGTLSCLPYSTEDRRPEKLSSCVSKETSTTNGWARGKARRDHAYHKSRSPSCDGEPLPARGKKKKKKSSRKKRRRSPSYSPSPVKKKKKKSSKKRKRNRYFSLGIVAAGCGGYLQRREGTVPRAPKVRERKKENTKNTLVGALGKLTATVAATLAQRALTPTHRAAGAGSSADLFTKTDSPPGHLDSQNGECHEYDSGNDTSSPPSTQTSSSRSKDSQEKRSVAHDGFGHAFSSGKPKAANGDNSSDSGNSFTSCFSQTKATASEHLSPDAQGQDQRGCLSSCLSCSEEKKRSVPPSPARSSPIRPCSRSESCSSMGRSSPGSSRSRSSPRRASPRYSRSRSCSSGKSPRSSSRSPSYSSKSCKKSPGSRSSKTRRSPSYSHYSPTRDREREHKHSSSEKESHRQRDRQRRRSYSPLRKRRRDSPSHLEARRITSARKRPIPYYRPSPSSSSSASSYSSWYSSLSRSPSRSRSYSSHRTSRSRSWSSSSAEGRSRSRSSGPRSSRSRSRSYDSGGSSDSLRR